MTIKNSCSKEVSTCISLWFHVSSMPTVETLSQGNIMLELLHLILVRRFRL